MEHEGGHRLGKRALHRLGHHHRTVPSSRASHAQREIGLPLLSIKGEKELQERGQLSEKRPRRPVLHDVIAHLPVQAGQGFQLRDEIGVGEKPDVDHHVRFPRNLRTMVSRNWWTVYWEVLRTVSAISRRGESISRSLRIASFAPPRAASRCLLLVSLYRRRRTSSPASRNRTWISCCPCRSCSMTRAKSCRNSLPRTSATSAMRTTSVRASETRSTIFGRSTGGRVSTQK